VGCGKVSELGIVFGLILIAHIMDGPKNPPRDIFSAVFAAAAFACGLAGAT
jgi:hypothetical protein